MLKVAPENQTVTVKGWVRTKRGNKSIAFVALNDGSSVNSIQIVADAAQFETQLKDITTGACLRCTGRLVESTGSGQPVEIQADEIEIYGLSDNEYPLQKKGHSLEFLREMPISATTTPLVLGAFATQWPSLSTSSSTTKGSSTSTHLL